MANAKPWTVMVYLAGDNNLDQAGLADLREMKQVGSTDDINVIAEVDRAGQTLRTKRFYLRRGGRTDEDMVQDLGETNTGDPKVLESFLNWGMSQYPANHYLLVLWNHGSGWDDENIYRLANRKIGLGVTRRGAQALPSSGAGDTVPEGQLKAISRRRFRRALFDTTVEKALQNRAIAFDDGAEDFLDSLELKRVLAGFHRTLGRPLDILGMDACLMSMAEVGYQVRDDAAYSVGSEELEPGEGWPYGDILKDLAAKPKMTPEALSKTIVKRYLGSYGKGAGVTQSAFDLSRAEELRARVDRLGRALSRGIAKPEVWSAVVQARAQVQLYDDPPQYVDLADLCQLLRDATNAKAITQACRDVEEEIETGGFVVASGFRGNAVANSHGVSIYFPSQELSPLYQRLDFAKKSAWNEFLARYVDRVRRRPRRRR